MPPIRCTPCRVFVHGQRYDIKANGEVYRFPTGSDSCLAEPPDIARIVRREAARQRRNRNARERADAMRLLGLVKTPYGWE